MEWYWIVLIALQVITTIVMLIVTVKILIENKGKYKRFVPMLSLMWILISWESAMITVIIRNRLRLLK